MAFQGISFPIDDYTRELDELDRLVYFERLHLDVHTAGATVTPVIVLNNTAVTLSTVNNSARAVVEVAINRLGPASDLQLKFSLSDAVQWYGIDLVIRPLDLGVQVVPSGQFFTLRGRTTNPATSIRFDVPKNVLVQDARLSNLLLKRFWIDAVTGIQTITPTVHYVDGTSAALAGITAASRTITEYMITTTKRVDRISIAGDFTNSAIIVYDIEADMYVPSARALAVG